jgi:hypothetical protein
MAFKAWKKMSNGVFVMGLAFDSKIDVIGFTLVIVAGTTS